MRRFDITSAGSSCCVKKDTVNNDNYYFNGFFLDESQIEYPSAVCSASQKELDLFAVCSAEGENAHAASYYAMEYLEKYHNLLYSQDKPDWHNNFINYLKNASIIINNEASNTKCDYTAKTTVCGIGQSSIHVAGVGDGALYMLREGKISELTEGFNKQQKMGGGSIPEPDTAQRVRIRYGDRFLLASGEIASRLSMGRIKQLMQSEKPVNQALREILGEAIKSGAKNSVTAIMINAQSNGSRSFIAGKRGKWLIALLTTLLIGLLGASAALYLKASGLM